MRHARPAERLWATEVEALSVLDLERDQPVRDLGGLDMLRDSGHSKRARRLRDARHDRFGDAIVEHAANESTVDLQIVDRQALQMRQGAQAPAKVVECE